MTKELRQTLKQRRDSISPLQRRFKAHLAANHLKNWSRLSHVQNAACYLSVQGELPTRPILQALWQKNKRVLLPLLHNDGSPTLHFLPFGPGTELTNNKFNIPEPHFNPWQEHPADSLDLVIMPLVGFDQYGSRMGMGGGFYDRTFEFVRHNKVSKSRPFMLGLAMDIQKVGKLDRQIWDVPLDGVLTESGIQTFT